MRTKETAQTVAATSPAAASTVVHTTLFKGSMFTRAEKLVVDALLSGGTSGTLDVYLQKQIASNSWLDFLHFPQLAAGTAKKYTVTITGEGVAIVEVGGGSDAAPGVALAAGTSVNCIPAGDVRIIFVAGAGTAAGVAQSITITPFTQRH